MDQEPEIQQKVLRNILLDKINNKTSITCFKVPECLFEAKAAEKHFSKFGRVQRIRLLPKKSMCIVEYDQQTSAERAVLNAGAYDGFMFDVTRMKPRVRRKSKRDDDPDWVPDPEVEEELSAMSGAPIHRIPRQKPMDVSSSPTSLKPLKSPIRKKTIVTTPKRIKKVVVQKPATNIEPPVVVTTVPTTLNTKEAAVELHKLRSRTSLTPDEKWRTLDARDRILRSWGGAGSRVKVGGATIGTCPDMCPEKELLHRQAEHQVMTLETIVDSDGLLEPWRAVKQYSRSSADQEIPMCYELRPATVLMRTCAYLLHEIADTTRQVTLADWFHFMWDRFRGIRKDITQQALCCADSICMVEICARFHAHCAARLADLEHTQFDQKLNTDNLTKCLQTLKHMYADVSSDKKPNEAEFRGYIALLNLGDANFWWEIKQLPQNIQKSESIVFAIKIYTSLDNNNYVKFFRLVREKATYLQACILMRYFNDVRARALARIIKAYAPRGGSLYPAADLMKILAFETVENMKSFISHYGLRFAKNEEELAIILNRNQFIEDSDPYPLSRAISLIESKRQCTVGEVISGGRLPKYEFAKHQLYSSFTGDGKLKESALIAEDLKYNTINDSNKDVKSLKIELENLLQGGKSLGIADRLVETKKPSIFAKPEVGPRKNVNFFSTSNYNTNQNKHFSFQAAIPVAPKEVISNSPEKVLEESSKNIFVFSKPQKTDILSAADFGNSSNRENIFSKSSEISANASSNLFVSKEVGDGVKKTIIGRSVFSQNDKKDETNVDSSKNIFKSANTNLFTKAEGITSDNLFTKIDSNNIFKKPVDNSSVFYSSSQINPFTSKPTFDVNFKSENTSKSPGFPQNSGTSATISPGSLFKSANKPLSESVFPSKSKVPSVPENIFKSVLPKNNVYEFGENDGDSTAEMSSLIEQKHAEEKKTQLEAIRMEEEKVELQKKEEAKRKEEALRKMEELKKIEEKRKRDEERKQEELKRKLEEERKIQLKLKAEEQERLFKERVDKESVEIVNELIDEIIDEEVIIILKEEHERLKSLVALANETTENICSELLNEICNSELQAEIFRVKKVMKKWFFIWRKQFVRNYKRRTLLEGTPVWLPDNTPQEEARNLRRCTEKAALKNMNAIHRGYRFTGELKQIPTPKPYNLLDIIRSPLLKHMKKIDYPYDKCFFWKLALVSPGSTKYIYKKINVEKWLNDVFSDQNTHDTSSSLIYVDKQSWNNLMDFAISISLINKDKLSIANEALNGANGVIFYNTENDNNCIDVIEQTLKYKYQYQIIPISIITAKHDTETLNYLHDKLTILKNSEMISDYRIFSIDSEQLADSINICTKNALKWLAKNCPKSPPIEIDYLKSICQRYLGNEIWYQLKSEKDKRTDVVLQDLQKLVICYNSAVDKLTQIITNEDIFNYTSFPLEFNKYLDSNSPYPKPYEFITSSVKQLDNINAIKYMMQKLKLPNPMSAFLPKSILNMQEGIRKYCNQISWLQDPEEVVCKVVAVLPNEFSDINIQCDQFNKHFKNYDLVDLLNVIVYEKINSLNNFDHKLAVYKKCDLQEYRNYNWLFEVNDYANCKNMPLDYDDDIDYYIEAKRRKICNDSFEDLMLEDKDCTLVEENIQLADQTISTYNTYKDVVSELEQKLNEEKKKSDEVENLLRQALSNV
ncbi:unnamed protein product [Euphydryas editha]|uniref:PCI domain-containing protein n=1 Tax=Euphydryas editha TaxID=104508 RepID=A0AAU9UE90_EUPED|nr:unnamed protein product [Euphydryas editha]